MKITFPPGSFPSTGLSELKRVSYLALSVGVTVQLNVFTGRLPTPVVGEVKENDPSDIVEGIVAVLGGSAGGCSPCVDDIRSCN